VRIALVTDTLEHTTGGNYTTVQRWLRYVRGVGVDAVPADETQEFERVPDLFHGYHALHGGRAARSLARRYKRPFVVSLGGTDLFACLRGGAPGEEVAHILLAANCVTGAFASFGDALRDCLRRDLCYATVPRGVTIPEHVRPRQHDGLLHVLLPAGLRPDKDPLLALDVAEQLVGRGLPVMLRILGPELDTAYAYRVRARAAKLNFVELGEIPFESMAQAYQDADVVWNTSFHEGGANALLEAVANGCQVLVRDVPGNRDFAAEEGAPFHILDPQDLDGLEAFHRALLAETAADRVDRITAGHAWLRRYHDPRDEARALKQVWQQQLEA
jgi:glycosyltransferase involved in cell wall biosynthesis